MSWLVNTGDRPIASEKLDVVEGLPFGGACGVRVDVRSDRIEFSEVGGRASAFVEIERVRAVSCDEHVSREVVELDKNPVLRGVVGGIVAGEKGAAVAALTGLGTKSVERTSRVMFVTIAYEDASGNAASIALADPSKTGYPARKVAGAIQNVAGLTATRREEQNPPIRL